MAFIVGLSTMIPTCLTLEDVAQIFHSGDVIVPDFNTLRALLTQPWNEDRALRTAHALKLRNLYSFDPEYFGITPHDAALMDPQQRKLIEMAVQCFYDAGVTPTIAAIHGPVACFVGAGISNYLDVSRRPTAAFFSEETRNYIANDLSALALRTSYFLNLNGPSFTILATCASGLVAFHQATEYISRNDGAFALVAATHIDFKTGQFGPEAGGIISPSGRCRPLSAEADGTYFSNGICAALLASAEATRSLHLSPYCRVLASGLNNDGRTKIGYTAPSLEGQAALITKVSQNAQLARRPDMVELHSTGTKVGDPIEMRALALAYQNLECSAPVLVGSAKSNFGHLNSAAGMLGVVKAALALRQRKSFVTVGCLPLTKAFDFDGSGFIPVTQETSLPHDAIASVSSFGIGGTNAHVVLTAYDQVDTAPASSGQPYLFLVGTHRSTVLDRQIAFILPQCDNGKHTVRPRDLAYTCRNLFASEKVQSLIFYAPPSHSIRDLGDIRRMTFLKMPGREELTPGDIQIRLMSCFGSSPDTLEDLILVHDGQEHSLRVLSRQSINGEPTDTTLAFMELVMQLCITIAPDQSVPLGNGTSVNGLRKAFGDRLYII